MSQPVGGQSIGKFETVWTTSTGGVKGMAHGRRGVTHSRLLLSADRSRQSLICTRITCIRVSVPASMFYRLILHLIYSVPTTKRREALSPFKSLGFAQKSNDIFSRNRLSLPCTCTTETPRNSVGLFVLPTRFLVLPTYWSDRVDQSTPRLGPFHPFSYCHHRDRGRKTVKG
jgi:hypothetical protein